MGYLHAGHISLVEQARQENDRVAASIFVNPTQFAPDEDLDSYPRALQADLEKLAAAGVDLVFTPNNDIMYPPNYQTWVDVTNVTQPLEGSKRPTHFRGVTTVVTKLFNIVQPTRAYFGQKDAQQVIVIRQMTRDLNINTDIVVCPIARAADGLALSSRNSYLSPDERQSATVLYRALMLAQNAIEGGQTDANQIRQQMRSLIDNTPHTRLDYISCAHPDTLQEQDSISSPILISLAVFVGTTRLIDNLLLDW